MSIDVTRPEDIRKLMEDEERAKEGSREFEIAKVFAREIDAQIKKSPRSHHNIYIPLSIISEKDYDRGKVIGILAQSYLKAGWTTYSWGTDGNILTREPARHLIAIIEASIAPPAPVVIPVIRGLVRRPRENRPKRIR